MSVTETSADRSGEAAPPEPRSRFHRLLHFYTSPGDRTPTWVGVTIGLLATAGLVVLGPTSQLWLLACASLLVYAVTAVVRPVEAWRVLRGPAGTTAQARSTRPGTGHSAPSAADDEGRPPEEGSTPDSSGWLPTRQCGRR